MNVNLQPKKCSSGEGSLPLCLGRPSGKILTVHIYFKQNCTHATVYETAAMKRLLSYELLYMCHSLSEQKSLSVQSSQKQTGRITRNRSGLVALAAVIDKKLGRLQLGTTMLVYNLTVKLKLLRRSESEVRRSYIPWK